MKRMISILLALLFLFGAFGAGAETNEELMASSFVLRHADRSIPKVAITVDDCYQSATEWIRRDVELCRKYGIAMTFFPLVYTGCLEEKYRDHPLSGDYFGFRECHVQPDWLLVYRVDDEELFLLLSRTGTHSDLFR